MSKNVELGIASPIASSRGLGARANEALYAMGWARAPWVAVVWLVAKRHRLMARDLTTALVAPPLRVPAASWSFLGPAASDEIARLNPRLLPAEIAERFTRGHECLGARLDGRLVHHRWHARESVVIPALGVVLELAATDRYMYHVYTAPDLRSQGLHSDGMWQALVMARAQGVQRSLSCIAWWNRPSLSSVMKAGYRPIANATRLGVGPLAWVVTSGRARIESGGRLVCPAASA